MRCCMFEIASEKKSLDNGEETLETDRENYAKGNCQLHSLQERGSRRQGKERSCVVWLCASGVLTCLRAGRLRHLQQLVYRLGSLSITVDYLHAS